VTDLNDFKGKRYSSSDDNDHGNRNESKSMVKAMKVQCGICDYENIYDYTPPVTWDEYKKDKRENKRYCPNDNEPCLVSPIYVLQEEKQESRKVNESDKSSSKAIKKKEKQEEDKLPETYIQKYSDVTIIAESVLIGNIPYFLVCEKGIERIEIVEQIDLGDKILKPYEPTFYINRAYTFNSKEQVIEYFENAKKESFDTLYRIVKSNWRKFIDADDFHISICAADTIFAYFQDIIGLTHYLFFVGNNGSGKSNNLKAINLLAYRNMLSTDLTYANIYQFLGSDQEGIGTICEDEADGIDEDRIKMSIYKNGYTTGFPVFRMLETTSIRRKQTRLNTFCFKAFAAERLPDSLKAKGFNERVLEIHCTYGFPEHDITDVVNPAGEEKFQRLLDELNQVRNMLLMYRLLHYHDPFPDIKINLENREKQLFKPLLRIFQNTETLDELLSVISKFVGNKRRANANTLYAFLYRVIKNIIETKNSYEIESKKIWDTVTNPDILPGEFVPGKKMTYDSTEFNQFSQKKITEIYMEVGATKPERHGSPIKLIFDKGKLERLGKIYELSLDIKVGHDVIDVIDGIDGIDVGLDKHLFKTDSEQETSNNYNNSSNNLNELDNNAQQKDNDGPKKTSAYTDNPKKFININYKVYLMDSNPNSRVVQC
jgi:hypothetical protein